MSSIVADISMKPESDGGRHCGFWTNYRPHLTPIGSVDYLGVTVVGVPESDPVLPGSDRTVEFAFLYPTIDYSQLSVGARFEIREGPKAVGEGIVTKILA